jgi:hypothetical protein
MPWRTWISWAWARPDFGQIPAQRVEMPLCVDMHPSAHSDFSGHGLQPAGFPCVAEFCRSGFIAFRLKFLDDFVGQ